MPVPTYDTFIEPLLRFLAARSDGVAIADIYVALADALGLTDADRAELLPSGAQAIYKNRICWAHDRLKRAGVSSSPRRGFWRLTPAGLDLAHTLQAASKGVFITTSAYTRDAREAAVRARGSIVLVDGAQLTSLMMDHDVGITHKLLRIPKVDGDYFEET